MAIVRTNNVIRGLSGSMGSLVIRNMRGKTIVSAKAKPRRKESPLQNENRMKFRMASGYAKRAMLDPDKKAYYWRKAKKLKLPNAYTAALSDYMRKGEVKEIDTRQYKGKAENTIRIHTRKKDFAIHKVSVSLHDRDGKMIESNLAIKNSEGLFIYKTTKDIPEGMPITIRVVLCDHVFNEVLSSVSWTSR